MQAEMTRTCEKCGGEITNEQIAKRQAGLVGGKLMCVACVDVLRKQYAMSRSGLLNTGGPADTATDARAAAEARAAAAAETASAAGESAGADAPAAEAERGSEAGPGAGGEEPIALISDGETAPASQQTKPMIKTLGARGGDISAHDAKFRRPLAPASAGATRCRTFHAKLSEGAVAYLDNLINEWLESSPDVYVKFSTATVGVFEGKHAEQHLIITVFY